MFDRIKIEGFVPPPKEAPEIRDINLNEIVFWTESLDKQLSNYIINKENKILKFSEEKKEMVEISYTGFLFFYIFLEKENFKNNYWLEYEAVFVEGKMLDVELIITKVVPKIL